MAFALTATTLTQTGTDTSLAGIGTMITAIPTVGRSTAYALNVHVKPPIANGFIYRCTVAGTTDAVAPTYGLTAGGTTVDGTATFLAVIAPYSQIVGGRTVYRISTFQAAFSGTLTWNAKLEGLEFYNCATSPVVAINSPAVVTINSIANTKPTYDDGLIIRPASSSVSTELRVNTGATLALSGARLTVSGLGSNDYQSVFFDKGSTITITNGWIKSTKNQVRWGELGTGNMLNMNINGLIVEKIFTTIFGVFGSLNGLAPLNSVTQTVSYGSFPSLTLRDYAPLDTGAFLDNYDIVNLYVINSLGSGLTYKSGQGPGKWISLQKECTLKTLTAGGSAINGSVIYIKDTNNGGRVNIPAIPNQLSDNVYIQATAGSGITPTMSLWVMHAQAQASYQSTPIRDYRTKTTVAGADLFDINVWAYGYDYTLLNDVSMQGNGVLALVSNLIADSNVTLTEANAVAKLASSFTVSGNVITVTSNSTLDNLYDVMKVYKTRPIQSQVEYPTIGAQPVTATGNQLTTAMSIVVNGGATLSGGTKFQEIVCAGVTVVGAINAISIVGNVAQATPSTLTGVTISGNLTYNTATTAQFTFTNSTLNTVTNTGSGIVTVKRVNSTLTPVTNVVAYLPTILSFTLNGGRIRVLDHLGTEQYNQTTDGSYELPVTATGTWSYKVVKYGEKPVESTITIDGGTKAITPTYIPDPVIVDTLANVQAYTSLETTQKIYDYYSLYLASAAGILLDKTVTLGVSLLDLGAFTLANSAVGIAGNVIGINTATISGVDVLTSGTITGISPTYPQRITDTVTTLTWVNLNLNGGRIRILDNLGVEQLNSITDATILLPKSSVGDWTYKVVKYGSLPIFSSFTVDGVIKTITPSYIPDNTISASLATVQAYVSLNTAQKIYDYYSLYLTTASGIIQTKSVTLTLSLLDLGAYNLTTGSIAANSTTISTGSATISGVNITTTGSITGITPTTYPQQITSSEGSTNWLQITPTTGQVYHDSINTAYSSTASTTVLPASFTSVITIYVTRRGYKKQVVTIPYTTTLLANQTFVLIPDTNVIDTTTDFASVNLTTAQLIYDAFSQYQATSMGITDTYSPIKSPGAIDFGIRGFALLSSTDFSTSPLKIKSTGLVSDTYYSDNNFTQGSATLSNFVIIRALNLDSEIVFSPDSITFYPSESNRDMGLNPGITISGGLYRFQDSTTVSGVLMGGVVYVTALIGTVKFFTEITLNRGANVMDLSIQGQIAVLSNKIDHIPNAIKPDLEIINNGIKKSSLLIPHNTNLL